VRSEMKPGEGSLSEETNPSSGLDRIGMLACEPAEKPVVLLARRYEVTVEIDDDGSLTLRQEDRRSSKCLRTMAPEVRTQDRFAPVGRSVSRLPFSKKSGTKGKGQLPVLDTKTGKITYR
jgi:hypothetical protein